MQYCTVRVTGLAIIVALLITACGSGGRTSSGNYQATVTGIVDADLSGGRIFYEYYPGYDPFPEARSLTIEKGRGNNMQVITITLPVELVAGETYRLTGANTGYFHVDDTGSYTFTNGVVGSFNVTETGDILTGDFEFVAYPPEGGRSPDDGVTVTGNLTGVPYNENP